jgi:hypothetical protein
MSGRAKSQDEGGHLVRGIATPVVVGLAILVFAAAVAGVWARRAVLDTDRYVSIIGPLADDPAVQSIVADRVTDRVMMLLDVDTVVGDALPERAAFLAAPMANAVQGFVHDQVRRVLASDAFARFWAEANRFAHSRVLAVLDGGVATLSTREGRILLNLLPLVNLALAQIKVFAAGLVSPDITIPEIDVADPPEDAIARLEQALGRDLPDDFGQIAVYDANELGSFQRAVRLFDRSVIALVILFPILVASAVWLSRRRRRTLIQLMAGFAIVAVVERRLALAATLDVIGALEPPGRTVAEAFANRLLASLFSYTGGLLAVAVLVLVVAIVTGPYPWAVAARTYIRDLGATRGGRISVERPGSPALAWVRTHRDGLMFGWVALVVLVLAVADVTIVGLLLILAIAGAVALLIHRVGRVHQVRTADA